LNDLWRFSPSSKQWTWIGGSSTYNGPVESVYGTPGQASASVWPGGNQLGSATTDASGNFWLFGGTETLQTASQSGTVNDLWKYSPTTGQWTSYPGQNGNYGTQGTGTSTTFPPGQQSAMAWSDAAGNFWIYGGWNAQGLIGSLWEFSPITGFWTWVGGSSAISPAASYGTLGTPAATNTPGGREGSAIWQDSLGNFWLFGGGEGFNAQTGAAAGVTNDLWEIVP
jgi:Galactose oxidase, central domain